MEWFRFYTRTLDSAKVQGLPLELFRAWVNLLSLARVHDGPLPTPAEIGFRLRVTERKALEFLTSLEAAKLLDRNEDGTFWMHDWNEHQRVSDDVAARVLKHRKKQKCNVTVTPSEQSRAETEQSRAETEPEIGAAIERMYVFHPKKTYLQLVPEALEKAVREKPLAEIEAVHAAWCKTKNWTEGNGRYAPPLAKWLSDRGYLQWPEGMAPETPKPKRKVKIIPYDPFGTGDGKPIEVEVWN